MHRNQLLVTNLDSQQVDDVGKWFAAAKKVSPRSRLAGGAAPGRCSSGTLRRAAAGGGAVPSGPGLIVQIYGRHFHNADDGNEGGRYVRKR